MPGLLSVICYKVLCSYINCLPKAQFHYSKEGELGFVLRSEDSGIKFSKLARVQFALLSISHTDNHFMHAFFFKS